MEYLYKKMTGEEIYQKMIEIYKEKREPMYYYLSPAMEEALNKAIREEMTKYIEQNRNEIEFNGKTYYYSKDEFDEFNAWQNKMRNLANRFDTKENNE